MKKDLSQEQKDAESYEQLKKISFIFICCLFWLPLFILAILTLLIVILISIIIIPITGIYSILSGTKRHLARSKK